MIFLLFFGILFFSGIANAENSNVTITHSGILDGNYFDTNNPTPITFTISNTTDLNYLRIKLDDNNSFYSNLNDSNEYKLNNLTNGKHTIIFDGNDDDGNYITGATINFYIDTINPDLPGLSTEAGTNFSNKQNPAFNLILNKEAHYFKDGNIAFSCNGTDWNYFYLTWIGNETTKIFYDFNIISGGTDCNSDNGLKILYVKIFDKFNRSSDKSGFGRIIEYNYDGTPPSTPKNFNVVSGNQEVTLTWTAPDADVGGSKDNQYIIYWRTAKDEDFKIYSIKPPFGITSETIKNLDNGTEYSFKLTTMDGAGNESTPTIVETGTPKAENCDCSLNVKRNGLDVVYVKNDDRLIVNCEIEKESDNVRLRYRYNSNSFSNLTDSKNNTKTSYEGEIRIDSGYNSVELQCVWNYNGTDFSSERVIYIDNESPTITWNSIDPILKETKELSAIINDNRTIKSVEFEIGGTKYGSTRSSNKYYFNLDTTKINNGSHELKVIAIDDAGNQSQKSITINIENIVTIEQQRTKAINDAKTKKSIVEDLIKYYNDRGLKINDNQSIDKNRADELLREAIELTSNEIAKTKAIDAKKIYDRINDNIIFNNINIQNFDFDKDALILLFSSVGLNQEQSEQAKNNVLAGNVERKLSIIKIGEEYRVQIEINFDLSNEENYKIVEVIPKELLDSATKIFSNIEFNIIEDDPIIEFIVNKNTKKAYYSFSVSKEEANKIIDEELVKEFKSPPIILKVDEKIEFSKTDWIILFVIIIIIIILIIGVSGIIFTANKNNLGKDNPIEKIKNKLFKSKEKRINWKHKK